MENNLVTPTGAESLEFFHVSKIYHVERGPHDAHDSDGISNTDLTAGGRDAAALRARANPMLEAEKVGNLENSAVPGGPHVSISESQNGKDGKREVQPTVEPLPAIPAPLLLSDGRRMWRICADAIPDRGSDDVRDIVDQARWLGCVLVADGCELILVEPRSSKLPDQPRAALVSNAGAVIALLHGESRLRCGSTLTTAIHLSV